MSGQPVTEWLRPLGVGEILDVAIKACRARFATLVKAMVVVIAPVIALDAVMQLSLLSDSTEVVTDPSGFGDPTMAPTVDLGDLRAILAGTLLVFLLYVLVSALATAAGFKVVSGAYVGGESSWRESLRFAFSRLGSVVWLSIVVVRLLTVIFAALVAVWLFTASLPAPTGLRALGVLAAMAVVVYLLVAWSVAVPVLLLEGWRGRTALERSRKLVAGRWWPAFAVLGLASLLSVVVQFGLSAVVTVVLLGGAGEPVTVVGDALANVASTAVTTPFLAAVTTVFYFDLRVRKEGFDLEVLARRIGIDPRAGTATEPARSPADLVGGDAGRVAVSTPQASGRAEWGPASPTVGVGSGEPPPPEETHSWSPAASWAVGFLAAYAFLVLIFATLAYLADLTAFGGVARAVVRILGIAVVAWGLTKRQRWAWRAAMVVSGLLALRGILGAVALGATAASGDLADAEALLPFGAVSAALLAGIALSAIGAFCALVVGLQQRGDADSTQMRATGPSPLVGPVLLVVTVLAGALGLSALRDSVDGRGGNAGFELVQPQVEPSQSFPDMSAPTTPPPPQPQGLAGQTQLPDGFGAIAVDDARRQVFVSSPTANVVSVLDFDGRLVRTIEGIAGPGALLVDGDRLLVASTTGGRIHVLDAATFEPRTRYGEGTLVKPGPIVKAGGRLWTSTGRCGDFETLLVSIDPASGATVVHPALEELAYCMELATSPADPNLLLGFDSGLSPATVVRVDVSGAVPTVVASRRQEQLGNLRQLAVLPRGDRFVAASGSPYTFLEFKTEDLAESGIEYPADAYPTAAATTAAKGGLVAAGISTFDDPDIFVYRAGDPGEQLSTLAIPGSESQWLLDRGLAWTADGSTLFAVSGDPSGTNVRFNVFTT
jgi:hypothetical protein